MLAFARLPFSLLVSSVILACTALPVESSETELLVLTPDDFDSTIANGVWCVPYCEYDLPPTYSSCFTAHVPHSILLQVHRTLLSLLPSLSKLRAHMDGARRSK